MRFFRRREPKFVAETLKWCNARRKEQGQRRIKKLPKGTRVDPLSCPCGLATGLSVGSTTYGRPNSIIVDDHPLPLPVRQFVVAFDGGELPQYEDEA